MKLPRIFALNLLPILIISGCATASSTNANAMEKLICSDVKKLSDELSTINGDIFSVNPNELNYQIKNLGPKWVLAEGELLKVSLKDISDFNLGSALLSDQPNYVPGAATYDLVLKLFIVNNSCSKFNNTYNKEITDAIVNKLFTDETKKYFG